MHAADRQFLEWARATWPVYFDHARVLELGSLNVNGTRRDYLTNCVVFGVDIQAGPCFDEEVRFSARDGTPGVWGAIGFAP